MTIPTEDEYATHLRRIESKKGTENRSFLSIYYIFYALKKVMQCWGQASTHAPQLVHSSGVT